jgi:hypothetical protein
MRYRKLVCLLLSLVIFTAVSLAQQLSKKMTNKDVIDMVSLGLSDDLVIDKIHTSEATDFDTSVPGLKMLKAAKVSDAVIRAMINPHPAAAATASAPAVPAPTTDTSGLPSEVGVYIMIKSKLTEVEPEVVGWQSGGVLKSMGTMGMTKGHVNGKVMKPKSVIQVPNPVEFIIHTVEGTAATEYQLLRLDEKSDRREFRAMTGGVIHASGGAEKNAVAFEPQKIANRVWRVSLKDLPKGEYGFLPPGVSSQSISSSGKIYTFGVIE